ncbi:MAG: hypothetical protein KGL46_00190 [Hyphomicrobiales bacterium]|nr:hypothetical protein [Hyphomicrobiales bacterium]
MLAPDGARIDITSKKGRALIAMLALAPHGERTRIWLQEKLWGSRGDEEGKASLRRELSTLRAALNSHGAELLIAERDRIRLALISMEIDVDQAVGPGELLEGVDIAGEEGFEDWLRESRAALAARQEVAADAELADAQRSVATGPSIMVAPFANATGETKSDYLAWGVGSELEQRLARARWLPVITYGAFVAGQTSPADVARRAGAKYLLEGALSRPNETFSLAMKLTEPARGVLIWSETIETGDPTRLDGLHDLLIALAAKLMVRIDNAEQAIARAQPEDAMTVRDLLWRGRWHLNRLTREDGERARQLFEEALKLDPGSPEALIQSTYALGWSIWAGREPAERIHEMQRLAQRAIAADPDDARGHLLSGIGEMWLRRSSSADMLLRRAISLNPSLSMSHVQLGSCCNLRGAPEEALTHLDVAMRLSPNDTHLFFVLGVCAESHWLLENWSKAIEYAEQSIAYRKSYWLPYAIKIVALDNLGDHSGAEAVMADLLKTSPKFVKKFVDWLPFVDPALTKKLATGVEIVERRLTQRASRKIMEQKLAV